jgi:DNA polymerase III subunit delta
VSSALESIRIAIAKGNIPSLFLLYGDDYQVQAATRALLDDLVPNEDRAFNLEKFDGRSASWEEIEAALMTPPFFPGKKAVLVDNAPYFLAQERKGEVADKVLDLWREGKQEEAARLFLDLLGLQGWTQEEWERAQGELSISQISSLCAVDDEKDVAQIEEILAFCRGREMAPGQGKSRGSQRLAEIMEQGLPPWATLLLTAVHVDRRTRLYRRFEETGKVLDFTLARERSGKVARDVLMAFLERRLKEAGKRIEATGKELILQRAGDQLWSLHQELEKLFLYVGAAPMIQARDVEEVFLDQGEGWIFDFTGALAQKDALSAFAHLTRLLAQGDHPLKILAVLASEVRRLLAARSLIERELRERWKSSLTFPQFQASVLSNGQPLLTRSAYADYMALQRAQNFTTLELLNTLSEIRDADMRLKSSNTPPARVLERLILDVCLGKTVTRATQSFV